MRGVRLQVINEFLGHRRIGQTLPYTHLSPSYQRKQVELLDLGAPEEEANRTDEYRCGIWSRSGQRGKPGKDRRL